MALAQLSIDIVAKLAQFERDMRKAADETKAFRDKMAGELEGLKSLAGNFAAGMAAGMAGAFSGGAIRDWIGATTEAADELNRLSQQTGVSVESLSAWGNVARRNGQDVDDLSELIQELSLKLTEIDTDTEGAGLALKQLGLDYKELGKLDSETAFKKVAEAVSQVEDSGKKTALVMATLGDEGQKYITTLNAIGSAAELEATITAEQAAAAASYKDSLAALGAAGDAWSQTVVAGITPALDEAARAIADVIAGTGGLTAEARTLSRDGTIADWARGAVTALTYLMDAGAMVTRSIKSAGLVIAGTLAMAGAQITAVSAAVRAVLAGDFAGAKQAIDSYQAQARSISADVSSDLKETWGETLGSQIRGRMEQMRAAGAEATKAIEGAKKSADGFSLVKKDDKEAQKKADAAKKALEEYEKLIATIRTKTTADEAEAQGLAPLTEAQRYALEVMTQIRDGRLKLSDEQRRTVTQYLEEAAAAEAAAEAAKRQAEWLKTSADETAAASEQQRQRTEALREQAAAARQEADEFGLSAKALQELRHARELDKAAALESRAEAMAGLDSHAELTAEWRDQAEAIRAIVAAQQDRAAAEQRQRTDPMAGMQRGLEKWREELSATGEDMEQFAGKSLRSVEDALTDLATTGKADWRGLVDSMLAEALRLQVIRPMMSSLLGGGSGGGVDSFNSWEVDAGLSSGGGGSWFSSAASVLGNLFGRANGGPVQSGQLYNVNERGPELLTVGNRTMLMMGDDSGVVTPLQSPAGVSGGRAGGGTVNVYQTFHFGGADAVTREDLRRTAAEAKSAALAEFANLRARGVRGYT